MFYKVKILYFVKCFKRSPQSNYAFLLPNAGVWEKAHGLISFWVLSNPILTQVLNAQIHLLGMQESHLANGFCQHKENILIKVWREKPYWSGQLWLQWCLICCETGTWSKLMFLKATSEFLLKSISFIKKLFEEELFYWMAQIKCTDVILKLLIKEFPCEFEYSTPAAIHRFQYFTIKMFNKKDWYIFNCVKC